MFFNRTGRSRLDVYFLGSCQQGQNTSFDFCIVLLSKLQRAPFMHPCLFSNYSSLSSLKPTFPAASIHSTATHPTRPVQPFRCTSTHVHRPVPANQAAPSGARADAQDVPRAGTLARHWTWRWRCRRCAASAM